MAKNAFLSVKILVTKQKFSYFLLIFKAFHCAVWFSNLFRILVSSKGESEPERRETRQKVDEDRKHEYLFSSKTLLLFLANCLTVVVVVVVVVIVIAVAVVITVYCFWSLSSFVTVGRRRRSCCCVYLIFARQRSSNFDLAYLQK